MGAGRRYLVTGAAGCIGAWVVAHLARRGAAVTAFDLSEDRRRLRLVLDKEQADGIAWIKGDLTDSAVVERAVGGSAADAIIHLAALQVPFCKADPALGARVNVVGHVNVMEAARKHGVKHLVYASSVAALSAENADSPHTLYGVYKAADEGIARVYALDWGVRSIGLRPHTVYGPGRDQGLTSAPTKAMLAAAAGRSFTIPFTGAMNFQFVGEVAEIFIRAADAQIAPDQSPVFDLMGAKAEVADIVAELGRVEPTAKIACEGSSLPFPAEFDDGPLRRVVGDWTTIPLREGITQSVETFRKLLSRGLVSADAA
ncbi:MAG TPA: NAD(P)-dependent oxidoreductase [Verrucomicrobiae bacterium]|nr:NAD(P)-dependent oxidoreductase [Verrucomicrobiae bacterium]